MSDGLVQIGLICMIKIQIFGERASILSSMVMMLIITSMIYQHFGKKYEDV